MTPPSTAQLRVGDWVEIYAQVAVAERVHPEDVAVELWSHNQQYVGYVRRDRVRHIAPPRGVALPCTALYRTPKSPNDALIRCRLHNQHADEHKATDSDGAPWSWPDDATVGYVEDRT